MTINDLKKTYKEIQSKIHSTQAEFKEAFNRSDEEIFLELCFCILAAGTSARLALNTVERIKCVVFDADPDEMQRALKAARYRFHTVRAEYIVTTREFLHADCGFRIKEKLLSFTDIFKRREYFADNKSVRGIGYKEGSHFLRNLGFKGYAILDKHVINSLYEVGAVESDKRPSTKKRYLALEAEMKTFSDKLGIDFDELDLLLWYSKTGEIIK